MRRDLTEGSITKNLFLFSLPLMLGNLLQQLYNVADTLIVGRYLGPDALAAVGSSYTFIVFLTSIILGLCMGSGAYFAILYGRKDEDRLKNSFFISFILIFAISLILNLLVFFGLDKIIDFLNVPLEIRDLMRDYIRIIFMGIMATFLYNYFSNILRSIGNSLAPVIFLMVSAVINIVLDIVFIISFGWGVKGAAIATVIAQYISALGIIIYYYIYFPELRLEKKHLVWNNDILKDIGNLSLLTSVQQSIMNFGILMVQGLVNSFGTVVMAGFAAAVKIDSFAYMPVQDFGNAFSTFIGQNYGAGKKDRIKEGIRKALLSVFIFCLIISILVFAFSSQLMEIFIDKENVDVIKVGVDYLRIVSVFYFGIGLLFMFYGFYRAINKPRMSIVLTVISLGTRVLLAYVLSAIPAIGVRGIWVAIPIGWVLADLAGSIYYFKIRNKI